MIQIALADVSGKEVYDLGCGTGILAIGAALCGAKRVVGVEADAAALDVARKNLEGFRPRLAIEFVHSRVEDFDGGRLDTVLQNPPYGAQKKHADRPFLEKAVELAGKSVYSLHLAETRMFIKEFVRALPGGWKDDVVGTFDYPLSRTFKFHSKPKVNISVDLHRITRKEVSLRP